MDELDELIATGASVVDRWRELDLHAMLKRFERPAPSPQEPTMLGSVGRLPATGPRQASRPPRVCIATSELAGPIRNGGVGTACARFAEAFAAAGHDVTILYVGPFETGDAAHWRAHFGARSIAFAAPGPPDIPLQGTQHVRASYIAYEWLKRQTPFDVIQFPEIYGVGFYTLQARRLGLVCPQTYMYVVLHSPTVWHRTENREHIDREDDLVLDFIERESVAWADAVVSPSRYLLSWAARWGFRFPRDVYIQPYVSPTPVSPTAGEPQSITDLVFFGRLESRKGLELFCDALDILAARGALRGQTVTFLGKIGRAGLEDGASYIRRRSERLGVLVRLETSLGQAEAVEYLRSRRSLAVMPSLADNMPYAVLECLSDGIPFISTTTGGIPEMVLAADHGSVLAPPQAPALAAFIERALRHGASPARIATDPATVHDEWIGWHEQLASRPAVADEPGVAQPLVSVCIATRNRPETLVPAIDSIRRQTYPRIELVVVDDASDRPEALELLDRLDTDFASRGWQLVRRTDRGLPAAARNTAAVHAHGEYLLFMDDDNLARPDEIATFVAAALHSGVPLLTCLFDHFRGEAGCAAPEAILRWLPLGPAVTLGALSNNFGDTNMLVRRDAFLRLGGFDEDREASFVEDWLFLSRAALAGIDMAVVPEPLFWYRVWNGANGQGLPYRDSQHRRLIPYLSGEPPHRRTLMLYAVGLHDRNKTLEEIRDDGEERARSLERRFSRGQTMLTIRPADVHSLEPDQELEVLPAAGGILLRSTGLDPIAWLPVSPPPFVHSIVRLEMTTPRPVWLQLFWSTRAVPYPSEEQSTVVRFPSGRHVRWAEIPAAAHVGRLRLDPARGPGDFVLHSLEIRCEGDGRPRRQTGLARLWQRLRSPRESVPMSERFRVGRPLPKFRADATSVTALRGVSLGSDEKGLVFKCVDDDPQVELTTIELTGRPIVARLDATASVLTKAQMFWGTSRRPYCEEQSAVLSLSPRRSFGYFAIPRGARGRLRFDPASSPCEVRVHSLEIRDEA